MRAAIYTKPGAPPEPGTFEDPVAGDDQAVLEVRAAGLNPYDLTLASGAMGPQPLPRVAGLEAVGTLPDGARVYVGSSVRPFGAFAERTLVDPSRAFAVPDGLADHLAVALGISGLAAWLPLTYQARLQPGERVLVLGATGVVGRIAVQAARLLGAGRVVGAGRHRASLEALRELGAHAVVALGEGDDAAALQAEADDGYDVVLDTVYGSPFVAALAATAAYARLVTIGGGAGQVAEVPYGALLGRTHIGHATGFVPADAQREAYAALTRHALLGELDVEIERVALDRVAEAWATQASGAHRKLVIVP